MGIDIRTLILIVGICHLMQVIVFLHQYKANKSINGPGWWLMWSAAECLGFILILLRSIPSLLTIVIIFQNTIILAGTIFVYLGVLRFFEKKINLKFIIPFFISFLVLHLFFTLVIDDIHVRTLNINAFISIVAFLTAFRIYKYKSESMASTANFNAIIIVAHGFVFAFLTVMIILRHDTGNVFSAGIITLIQYFDALIVGLLWTFGFILMINQRLNAEISEAKAHFELIFSTSPDATVISRLSDGMFLDCNESYTKITGYKKEDISGKSSMEIELWKKPSERDEMVRIIRKNGFCENFEALFQRKDGGLITGLTSAKIITIVGVPHILSVTRDITDRKKIEEVINLKNEELVKINAEKDKFFSIIAHDLKTPFNAISGFSELLIEKVREKDSGGINKYADIILQSSRRGIDLLMNLMEWSQSKTGGMEFKPGNFEMENLINKVVLLFADIARQKSITISKPALHSLTVYADKNMISTVMRNLISNALKFTRPGGKISIAVEGKQNQIHVKVSDNGIGIEKNSLEKLFRIDENFSTPGTLNEKGTGLGLILCKEFVEKNGGKIWVESTPGKGSDFYFTIPCTIIAGDNPI
jgi:PAS domain S-box-containing protein